MRVQTALVNRGNETKIFFLQLKFCFLKNIFLDAYVFVKFDILKYEICEEILMLHAGATFWH